MTNQEKTNKIAFLLLGLSLAAGLIVSTFIFSRTVEKIKMAPGTIYVKGYAERVVSSDVASWFMRITARDADLAGAYEKLQKDCDTLISYLKDRGIQDQEIKFSPASTTIEYTYTEKGTRTNQIEGYVLGQNIEVSSYNVQLINTLSGDSSSLIKQGIEFTSYSPSYYVSTINKHKIDLLGEATKDARLRAEQLAVNSGAKVGTLESASQGVFQITPVYSTQTSNYGVYDTSTIQKAVKAVVTIQFSLRR